jgi:tetratricopeptide (TPR) repeat protein
VSRYESAYVGTEGLFFQRLRRQARWMFVLLALVFGVGFVAFGVGSDVQGGIADVIGIGAGDSGQVSAEDAREKLAEKPGDPVALRELATALQTEGKPLEAIDPLEQYTTARPKDEDALRELAGLYLSSATVARQDLAVAQEQATLLDPGSSFLPPSSSPLGQALANQPITQAATGDANAAVNDAYSRLVAAYTAAKTTYQKIVKLAPDDADAQVQLAQAAQNSGDNATALTAYKRYLKLAPDDPSAPFVRDQIKQLEAAAASAGAAPSAG